VEHAVAECADAVAGWHSAWLRALGLRSTADVEAWRALDPPPRMYFSAITLRPDTPPAAVVDAPGSVCDSWQTLDLARAGFRAWRRDPWYRRPPAADAAATPPELEIVRVTTAAEVEELEAVSVRGFGGEGTTIEPGAIHPGDVLDDPAMALWLGRVNGTAVGAAMSYRTDRAVGIFGVTTIQPARRQGYGAALTAAAMLPETGLPAVLASSREGRRVYERLGFERVGELTIWIREGPGR
jgi:ribosomal protein S18 acetylase RimI-like enzyme